MATRGLALSTLLVVFLSKVSAQFVFDDVFGDLDSCEDVCENTYALHTYEKAVHLGYCRRGCRLFTIIDFVDEFSNLNQTQSACAESCREAYTDPDNQAACILGCTSQLPIAERRQKQLYEMEPQVSTSFMYPLLYMHNMYSNVIDKLSQQMTVSWSFYSQGNDGQMVIVRSEPKFYVKDENSNDWRESEYKTSNYIETNLEEVDNSATPDLRHSQVHAMERDLDLNMEDPRHMTDSQSSDWLSCISHKTGLPRLLVTGTIFVSAFVMIWICLSSVVTAPEQRVAAQPQPKLSIYGDLEYLTELGDKALLAGFKPQELNQNAPPIPIKVKVQRI